MLLLSVRWLPRAAVVAIAALSALAVGVVPAAAAPPLRIALDPAEVEVYLLPLENVDLDAIARNAPDDEWITPVEVPWGGEIVVVLPAALGAADASWTLQTGAELDEEPTRTLSTEATGAHHLDVVDRGDGAHRVGLPADDGTGGPIGVLTVDGLAGDEGIEVWGSLTYLLELTGSGSPGVTLVPQLGALSSLPCSSDELDTSASCPPYQVTAGATVEFTVPADSLLRGIGLGRLEDVTVALLPLEDDVDEDYTEYDRGYDDGYDEGYAAEYGDEDDIGDAYGAHYGAGYSDDGTSYDDGYDDGSVDGRTDGAADAADAEPVDSDPAASDSALVATRKVGGGTVPDPSTTAFASLADELTTARADTPATPAETMARVAELVAAAGNPTGAGTATAPADVATSAQASAQASGQAQAKAKAKAAGGVSGTGAGGSLLVSYSAELPVSLTASRATVTVPGDTEPGTYELILTEGTSLAGPSSAVSLMFEVAAEDGVAAPIAALAPAAPVGAVAPESAPEPTRGLTSATDWTDPVAPRGTSPLVALGGGAVLLAGLGAAAVVRPRRRRPVGE